MFVHLRLVGTVPGTNQNIYGSLWDSIKHLFRVSICMHDTYRMN